MKVRKYDGRIQPYNEKNIADSIFKAARRVGGRNYKVAERLAKEVTNYLRKKYPDVGILDTNTIGDAVEKILIEFGHAKTAKAFILHRERKKRARERIKVVRKLKEKLDTTDRLLLVSGVTKSTYEPWNKLRIVEYLQKLLGLSSEDAFEIADNVESKIIKSGMQRISTSLIRALIENELFELGYTAELEKQNVIGIPIEELEGIISEMSNENANTIANNPEAVNLAIAEKVLKQYALQHIFSKDVADAHLKAAIHLHDLGYPVRVYCSSHSIEYIKKYGLELLNLTTTSSPAKHAMTLTGHINTFLASMQAYYAGALGLGFANIFYAPLTKKLSDKELLQQMQYLIFSCSQNAFSRGSQTLFIDLNIHLGVPDYMKDIPAIGSKGKYMLEKPNGVIEYIDDVPRDEEGNLIQPTNGRILTYGDFEEEAQRVAKAMLDVWRAGDSRGQVFPFPKCDLHINQQCFDDPKQRELLDYACLIASENGAPYFVFDREECTLSMCCRLRYKIKQNYMLKYPESIRFCGFQNVTVNLPQAAYRAKGDIDKTLKEINNALDLVLKAHLQKKDFIAKLLKPGMPLWQLGKIAKDGRPYLELDKATYIVGLLGLNECVKFLIGQELHESNEAYKLGLKIISAMYLRIKQYEKEYGLHFSLEESPAESASYRLARVDLQRFPEAAKIVRGNIAKREVYYTNSCHFAPDAPIDIIERIEKQGRFNTLIESGAITHVFLGEQKPDPKAVFKLVEKTWKNTQSAQITISPEFTICRDCGKISRGYKRFSKARREALIKAQAKEVGA